MLSDEEKKELDNIKESPTYREVILLRVIEKQSKEIEELKNGQIDFWISDKEIEERIRNKFVSKDKIKAKIEELEKDFKEYENGQEWEIQDEIRGQIDVLQSLLEKE